MDIAHHSTHSSYREALLEHIFLGDVMRCLWLQTPVRRMEVLKPQTDADGYDVVLDSNGICRHVQLKASYIGAKTARVSVHVGLAEKPSGCVIWLRFNSATLALGPFLWFGGSPGEKLPDLSGFLTARHSKGNSQGVKLDRPNLRVVPVAQFESISSLDDLVVKLFG